MTSTASRPALRPGPRRLISERPGGAQLDPPDSPELPGEPRPGQQPSADAKTGRPGNAGQGSGRTLGGKLLGVELLASKLQTPVTGLEMLPRQRVTDLLEKATRHRVTLVTGPAGSGKTVACAIWASMRAKREGERLRIGWLSLDPEDAEPATFWPYLVAAMIEAGVIPAEAVDQFATAGADELPEQVMTAVGHAALTASAAIIIDDVHQLSGSPVLTGLDQLIRRLPGSVHLVLAGRSAPGRTLSRLRVSGDLADIGPAELACSQDELDGYLTMLGLSVEPAEQVRLLQRTEGWLAGLRLAAMNWPEQAAGRGQGADALADYLRDEVLGGLDAPSRLLLLRTSLLEVVPGELAAVLSSDRTAAKLLDRLAREHRLVEHAGTGSYRYHPLLRELLVTDLRSELPAEETALEQRAASWYAEHDRPVEAVLAATSAGDWELATRVLADAGPGVLSAGRPAELERAVTALPADQQATAVVATAMAAAQLWQDQPDLAGPLLDRAVDAMPAHSTAAKRPDGRWLAALRVMQSASQPADPPGWLPQAWAEAEQGQLAATTVADHQAVGLLWLALGWASLRTGNASQANIALTHASQQLADTMAVGVTAAEVATQPGPAATAGTAGLGMAELRDRAQAWQAFAAAQAGELTAAGQLASELAASPAGARQDIACLLALCTAQVSLCRDDTAAARLALDDAGRLGFGQLAGEPRLAALGGLIRVRCAIADADAAAARALLAQLEAAHAPADPVLARQLHVLGRYAALAAGDRMRAAGATTQPAAANGTDSGRTGRYGAAGDWPDRPDWAAADGSATAALTGEVLCQARLLLADGAFTETLELVTPLLAGPAQTLAPTKLTRVTALLHAAVAHRGLGEAPAAAQYLLQALALAEPEECYLPFLSGGVAVRSAITVLLPPPALGTFARAILERFDGQLPPAGSHKATAPSLTESELAVLRFLPSHMTNQEIAEALFLSINTVKTHLSAAYRKLGAANRRQAIGIGRRSGLLLCNEPPGRMGGPAALVLRRGRASWRGSARWRACLARYPARWLRWRQACEAGRTGQPAPRHRRGAMRL